MLFLVAAGKRHPAIVIVIDSAFVHSDTIYAAVTELDATQSCGSLGMQTTPMALYRVNQRAEPVVFVEHGMRDYDACGS